MSAQSDQPAIEFRGVSFSYPGAVGESPIEALRDITMTVPTGTRLGVLGPNGGGKSTLVRLMLGLLTPQRGTVRVLGLAPGEARARAMVGYLPQKNSAETGFPISVLQAVALPIAARTNAWRLRARDAEREAMSALELVGMSEHRDRPIGALSGGQLQRALIARAVVARPALLVLDEPTVGVDAAGQRRFAELIDRLHAERGMTIVTVSHDLRAIAAGSDRVACLHRSVHFHDAPQGLTPTILGELFAHDVEPLFGRLHVDAHAADGCEDPTHHHHTGSCDGTHGHPGGCAGHGEGER